MNYSSFFGPITYNVMSYGKNLYLLKPSMQFAQDPHFQKFDLTSTATFESNIRFDVDQKRDSLLVVDDL